MKDRPLQPVEDRARSSSINQEGPPDQPFMDYGLIEFEAFMRVFKVPRQEEASAAAEQAAGATPPANQGKK